MDSVDDSLGKQETASGFSFTSLEAVRNKLLDLSARNRLLNFRHTKRQSLRIVDELPDQLYSVLLEGGSMTIMPVPEPTEPQLRKHGYIYTDDHGKIHRKPQPDARAWAKVLGIHTEYELAKHSDAADKRHSDSNIQTLLYPWELEPTLRTIRNRSISAIEETGANILFLNLGFLQWYESHDSDKERLAPLFTIPLNLSQSMSTTAGARRYDISVRDDGLLMNVTLREKLANDFAIVLPDIDEECAPEQYLSQVQESLLVHQPRWKIRRFGTVGLLNFAKQTMYEDLNPDRWPEGANIQDHALIKRFFSSEAVDTYGGSVSFAPEHDIDQLEEQHTKYPIIFDADSSQHSALVDAIEGDSLVVEGPPGTGKSQTITNLIAACISAGKSVLFVAEKMAALEVVKDRLDQAGLGDFCLELHSHRTNKQRMLEDLTSRIERKYRPPAEIESEIARLEDHRQHLRSYVETVNSPWKNTGLTPHEIFSGTARYQQELGINPADLTLQGFTGELLTKARQKELDDYAHMLQDIYRQVAEQAPDGDIANHFWFGVGKTQLTSAETQDLVSALDAWSESLALLNEKWQSFAATQLQCGAESLYLDDIDSMATAISALPNLKGDEPLAALPAFSKDIKHAGQWVEEYVSIHRTYATLSRFLHKRALAEPSAHREFAQIFRVTHTLGTGNNIALRDFRSDIATLDTSRLELEKMTALFSRMNPALPPALSDRLSLSLRGLGEFQRLAQLVAKLPADLWVHRDSQFDNEDLDPLLADLTVRMSRLTPLHKQLRDEIRLHALPSSTELKTLITTVQDDRWYRWILPDWRKAKKGLQSLFTGKPPRANSIAERAESVLTYCLEMEDLEQANNRHPLLASDYRGADTPIDRFVTLRNWYKAVREAYGGAFSVDAPVAEALFNLDRSLALGIVQAARDGAVDTCQNIERAARGLAERYTGLDSLRDEEVSLSSEDGPFKTLDCELRSLLDQADTLIKKDDVAFTELIKAAQLLELLHNRVAAWKGNGLAHEITKAEFKFSVEPGSYSEKSCESIRTLVEIAGVCAKHREFANALDRRPTPAFFEELVKGAEAIRLNLDEAASLAEALSAIGQVNLSEWRKNSDNQLNKLIAKNRLASENIEWLKTWMDYRQTRGKLEVEGLKDITGFLEERRIDAAKSSELLRLAMYFRLGNEILEENTLLANATGLEQNAIQERFRNYDLALLELQREQVAFNASRKKPPLGNSTGRVASYSETSLIKHEAGKKRRHIAIRDLMDRAGESVRTVKPCFMMSPMSVAQYLKPGRYNFDVVVMDEASQIRPEDALGAIARGSQLVVVGDPKQLPPTNFFQQTIEKDSDEDTVVLEESESILEAVIPMFKTRRLRWHYRSRHESLIAYSNQQFYNSNLIIFPSPHQKSDEFGISFRRVMRGRFHDRRNVREAQRVVEAAAQHLKSGSGESAGIVAMNIQQRDEIEKQFEELLKADPVLQVAYEKDRRTAEPLFFKNLENVQGDERDNVIISMTYGPEQIGGRVMQRFGPINSHVGWRRLNVLFTRSKKRMHIFSSMQSSDIVTSADSSTGVKALRAFLNYCETGHLHVPVHTGRPPDSDFEIAVMDQLAKHGFECEPQLGVAGFFLDLAVRDPGNPGRFLMGIECDGASYHSAKSTRDRDRLRQEILEGHGWRIRRIWSTDWFKHPEAQLAPIIRELNQLKTVVAPLAYAPEPASQEQDGSSALDAASGLEQENQLVERLNQLKTEIADEYPDTDEDFRLLRSEMMNIFLTHKPYDREEFYRFVPADMRQATDSAEAGKFLSKVFEAIADYG